MRTLKEVNIGETVTVVKVTGEGPVKRRIMDMGITKGTDIYVRKVAPLGDPIEVMVRGYELSLRKADVEMIQVEKQSVAAAHREPPDEARPRLCRREWRRHYRPKSRERCLKTPRN